MNKTLLSTLLLFVLLFFQAALYAQDNDFEPVEGMTIGQNWIAFEAEATNSPLGKWQIIGPDDYRYKNNSVPPVGQTHLEFTGNNPSIGDPNSPLEYKFVCPKTGKYRLGARLFQRLEGLPDDKCNDVYIRMEGDFTTAGDIPTYQLKKDMKFYGRGVNQWGALYNLESHSHGHAPALYNLTEGEVYTLTVSGRAQRTNIDYWLLYETSLPITLKGHKDLAAVNDEKYRPVVYNCQTFEAIEMKYTGIEGFADAKTDRKAGMKILQIPDREAWAAAKTVFKGDGGMATFTLNALQETDGESSYRLKVNGELIGEVTNDRIYGTGIEDYAVQSHLMNKTDILLQNNDTIQIEFKNATNGLVPEGDLTATSRGRWLNLEICTTGSFAEYSLSIKTDEATLLINDSLKLAVQKNLPFGADTTLIWSGNNPDVVSVGEQGLVKAHKVGTSTISVSAMNGRYTASCKVKVVNSLPFSGDAIVIPGLFEAEDYDIGGEGRAYHDMDAVNTGNAYRVNEGVDINKTDEGAYVLSSVEAGEWLRYTLSVRQSGSYFIQAHVSSFHEEDRFFFDINEEQYTASSNSEIEEPLYETIRIEDVKLEKGEHTLELRASVDDIKIDWIGIYESGTSFNVTGVSLYVERLIMDAGETEKLIAAIQPVNADDKTLHWSSADESVAAVTSDGLVEALNEGSTFIKATSVDGDFADSVYVKVNGTSGMQHFIDKPLIYPNPTTGLFSVILNDMGKASVFVYNMSGNLVRKYYTIEDKIQINKDAAFMPGIYMVKVATKNRYMYHEKVIVH